MDIENKCVIVADEALPVGLLANTAAILGITLGKDKPEFVGNDIMDASGTLHKGITTIPIPILKGSCQMIRDLRGKLKEDFYRDLFIVDFSDVAQSCITYNEYIDKAEGIVEEDFTYFGIAIYGSKKKVNKLTGFLPLLK